MGRHFRHCPEVWGYRSCCCPKSPKAAMRSAGRLLPRAFRACPGVQAQKEQLCDGVTKLLQHPQQVNGLAASPLPSPWSVRGLHSSAARLAVTDVKVPSMGESITEGTVAAILRSEGQAVAADDVLLQIETDKVSVGKRVVVTGGGGLTSARFTATCMNSCPCSCWELSTTGPPCTK